MRSLEQVLVGPDLGEPSGCFLNVGSFGNFGFFRGITAVLQYGVDKEPVARKPGVA
ncbi:hypothetical protein ES703_49658 [subsurface metagenome]